MKKIFLIFTLVSSYAFGASDIDVTIDWVDNVAKSTVLEVCGKAISKSGKWPLVVSLTHGESTFSTITNKDGKYCQLLGRQTYNGKVDVSAASMDGLSVGSNSLDIK